MSPIRRSSLFDRWFVEFGRRTTRYTGGEMGVKDLTSLTNVEIVTVAVYLCGGSSRPVDLEDVAVKADQLAPGRFTWRKYKSQISLEHVRVYLSDAKKDKNGNYLTGTGDAGWMLTEAGDVFARSMGAEVSNQAAKLARPRQTNEQKRWISRERSRLLESSAFEQAQQDPDGMVSDRDAEQLFKIDDYVQGLARVRKIDRYVALLGDDPVVGPVVRRVADQLRRKG